MHFSFLHALVEHAGERRLRLEGFVEVAEALGRPLTVNGADHVFQGVFTPMVQEL